MNTNTVKATETETDAVPNAKAQDTTSTTTTTDQTPDAQPSQEDTSTQGEDWKTHARTWERRAKADRKQVEALTEAINGKDTTIDDLRSKVAALEQQAQRAELIAAAASEYGVPADLLHGATEEEIAQSAKRLATWREETAPTAPAVPALADSGAGVFPPRASSVSLDEQIAAAQAAGDFKTSAALKAVKLANLTA